MPGTRYSTPEYDEENHHSDEVYDIISSVPSWLVQWGTTLLVLILLGAVILSWYIQYPDTITVPLQLTARNAPKPVNSKITGKLVQLMVREADSVRIGQALAYLESTANHEQVLAFAHYLDLLYTQVNRSQLSEETKDRSETFTQLGELQPDFQAFKQSLTQYLDYQQNGYYTAKRAMLQADLVNLVKIADNLQEQRDLVAQDLAISVRDFKAQQDLANQKVISAADFRREESRLLSKEMLLKQTESIIFQNFTSQAAKRKEFLELDKLTNEQRGIMVQAVNTLRSSVDAWKARYILAAPLDGQVYFSTLVENNQTLTANQEVFYISPSSSAYFAEALIPQQNLGKVLVGQKVIIKFAGYPYQEYGTVAGTLTFVSRIPNRRNTFLAKVSFPHGLRTAYGTDITYRQGMMATGEIITRDSRLLEKLFYNLRQAIDR
ncbi:HlyD family secretion protein [Hymenobacter rubripertinctus]|uniref:HlyD family efflux transporter periplasmic adaptor subunit n=1 Tax=Hymenobacter rubripertinctus TaxID=2029981 RepID=A0A418QPK3_9BACT|nr:HlyD family efflux transporter periplasmic adaptor subunit [Hymenobacter rubripertinctus]RIY07146.1 HlyD family efflux transporter periplasmic adaptor subunit [Hymenobacter rubripertinctus]